MWQLATILASTESKILNLKAYRHAMTLSCLAKHHMQFLQFYKVRRSSLELWANLWGKTSSSG